MSSGSLYKAVWRWHFYAGVSCIPFLLLLSATGAIYLFDRQIEDVLYAKYYFVPPSPTPALNATALRATLRPNDGETLLTYFPPAAPDRSAAFSLLYDRNKIRNVYVNPYTGEALGSIVGDTRPMNIVKQLHNLQIAGVIGNRFVECVAGWVIILFVTGVYLWWPKSAREALRVRGGPGQRTFWRDIHRVIGITAGVVVCLQAMTGLPWTGLWGSFLRAAIDASGQGKPAVMDDEWPESTLPAELAARMKIPPSDSDALVDPATIDIGLDKAVAIVEARGMPPGYQIGIPSSPNGIYAAMIMTPDDPAKQRVIHIDRYSGKTLTDLGYRDYGGASRLIELGYAVHQGNYFGTANRIVMLAMCICVWLLAATGVVMWWKRRPKTEGLSAPPRADRREARVVFGITLVVSLLFPLTALSLALLVVVDRFALAGWSKLRGARPGT